MPTLPHHQAQDQVLQHKRGSSSGCGDQGGQQAQRKARHLLDQGRQQGVHTSDLPRVDDHPIRTSAATRPAVVVEDSKLCLEITTHIRLQTMVLVLAHHSAFRLAEAALVCRADLACVNFSCIYSIGVSGVVWHSRAWTLHSLRHSSMAFGVTAKQTTF